MVKVPNKRVNAMKPLITKTLIRKTAKALLVQVEAGQGFASPGNTKPADLLVVVTDPWTGLPVAGLKKEHFQIINHFSLPGSGCGFSNNIVFFSEIGCGAYQVQVGLVANVPGCKWVRGDYLTQVSIDNGSRAGQGTATLRIL